MMHKSLVQIGCFLFLQYVLISADPLSSEFKDLRKDRKEFLSGENFTVLPLSLPIPKFIDQDVSESTTFPSQAHPVLAVDAKSARTSKRPGSLQKHRRRKGKRGKHGKRTKGNRVSNNARKNSKYFLESKDLEDQKEILRSTMRYMFGFDHILTTPEMVKQKLATENVGDKSDESINGREATKLKRRGGKEDMKLEALDLPDPPDFMLELYEVYSKDNSLMMLYSRSQGDTIRSFFPSPADPRFRKMDRGRPVIIVPVSQRENGPNAELVEERKDGYQLDKRIPAFLFNLSSIPSEEELVSVEIRLDGRAKSSSSGFSSFQQRERFGSKEAHLSSWNLKIGVYEIRRTGCRGDVDCSNDDISKVFIKVGMTVAIKSPTITTWSDKELLLLARKARKSDHVMLVKFTREPAEVREELSRSSRHINKSSQNGNDHHEPTSGDLPSAFTVPESERPKRNSDRKKSLASVQPFLSEPLQFGRDFNEFDFELDISRVPMLVIYSNDSRTVEATDAPQISPLIWGALENVTASLTRRTRRSTDNISEMGENQFPETTGGTDDTEYDPNIMQTESDKRRKPYVIKRGKAQSRQTKRINNSLSNDQTELHDNEKSRRFLMDTLKDKNTTRRRRKNKKCEDRKGRRRKSCRKGRKGKGKNIPPHESLEALNRAHLLCGRRSLHVDFADIGWSDWIISPNYFDAYYCSGRCEIPHMQSMQGTSNHAFIQALIKAIGVNKEIPAPCCVPEKLMSLSVLYYDEEKNVVLRVYRNMSVETCSCR